MRWLLFFFFLLLPAYRIRFQVGHLPTTALEVLFWIIIAVWLILDRRYARLSLIMREHRSLLIAIILFLTSATISIFTSLNTRAALGEWKAFYVEPVMLFFILITSIKTKKQINTILLSLITLSLITSMLAIYQHFTGFFVPHAFWANRGTYRVTAWYGFPNAVGLFLAPLVPLMLYAISDMRYDKKLSPIAYRLFFIFSIPTVILAIIFAKSTGGIIGAAAGIGVLLLFHKKTRVPALVAACLALIAVLVLPPANPVRQELLAQNRSGHIRLAMWKESVQLLKDRPLLGAGLASYATRVEPYHTTVNGEGIEIFHHPHNIFLTMWVNLGLLGLLGFIWILVWFYRTAISYKLSAISSSSYLLASMTTILVTGLADSPYIKNDLAFVFWLLPALLLVSLKKEETAPAS